MRKLTIIFLLLISCISVNAYYKVENFSDNNLSTNPKWSDIVGNTAHSEWLGYEGVLSPKRVNEWNRIFINDSSWNPVYDGSWKFYFHIGTIFNDFGGYSTQFYPFAKTVSNGTASTPTYGYGIVQRNYGTWENTPQFNYSANITFDFIKFDKITHGGNIVSLINGTGNVVMPYYMQYGREGDFVATISRNKGLWNVLITEYSVNSSLIEVSRIILNGSVFDDSYNSSVSPMSIVSLHQAWGSMCGTFCVQKVELNYNPDIIEESNSMISGNYESDYIFLNISTTDTTFDTIKFEFLGFGTVSSKTKNFYYNFTLVPVGEYDVTVFINDSFGNVGSKILHFSLFPSGSPEVVQLGMVAGNYVSEKTISYTLNTSDGDISNATVDCFKCSDCELVGSVVCTSFPCNVTFNNVGYGHYFTNVTVNDFFGNTGRYSYEYSLNAPYHYGEEDLAPIIIDGLGTAAASWISFIDVFMWLLILLLIAYIYSKVKR
jgi:hypothetical protein